MAAVKLNLVSGLVVPGTWSLREKSGGISQSLLGSWQCCPRRFLFQLNRWYDAGKERNMAYGSMVHEVLDVMYTLFHAKDITYKDLPDVINDSIQDYQLPPVFTGEEQELNKAIGTAMLQEYVIYYRRDFEQLRFEDVESKFCVPFGPFWLRGKKDGRFRDRTGGIWHIEHKNYSRINEDTIQLRLSFDLQNLFYLLADQLEYKRLLKGVLYNVLRKPDLRKEMMMGNVIGHIRKAVKARPKYYFLRWEIPYTQYDVGQFKGELEHKLSLIDHACHISSSAPKETLCQFYKNECACDQPYSCEFLQACSGGHLTGYKRKNTLFTELA